MLTPELRIAQLIMQIDQCVSLQISQIIQNEKLQALESSWRNLDYIVKQKSSLDNVKVKILPINKEEFSRALLHVMDFDQNDIFEKIYNTGFGIAGGEPFGLIIGDYYFSNNPRDIQLLQIMAQISSAAFAPFITSASSSLLGLNQFADLGKIPNIHHVFQQFEYRMWQRFRTQPETCFLGLVVPKHLVRLPYRTILSGKTFQYHEPNPEKNYLWGNAAYAFAAVCIKCFKYTGWFASIRGISEELSESGGRVPDVVNADAETRYSELLTTEAFITDNQERELSELGFLPICQAYPGGSNVLYSNCSAYQTPSMENIESLMCAKANSLFQYLLCACRFAHYLKIIIRDQIGSFITPEECENKLNNWLWKYVAANNDLSIAKRASFPLQNGIVKITASSKEREKYYCKVRLKPFFQLEQLHADFTFVTTIKVSV